MKFIIELTMDNIVELIYEYFFTNMDCTNQLWDYNARYLWLGEIMGSGARLLLEAVVD